MNFIQRFQKKPAEQKKTCEKDFKNKKYKASRQSATSLFKAQMMS